MSSKFDRLYSKLKTRLIAEAADESSGITSNVNYAYLKEDLGEEVVTDPVIKKMVDKAAEDAWVELTSLLDNPNSNQDCFIFYEKIEIDGKPEKFTTQYIEVTCIHNDEVGFSYFSSSGSDRKYENSAAKGEIFKFEDWVAIKEAVEQKIGKPYFTKRP